jgi:hypothetical protein
MARKLILSILLLSFAFLELLAVRQGQINTVHEMAQLHQAINSHNETINALSIDIETICSPIHLRKSIASVEVDYEND